MDLTPEERYTKRLELEKPVLDALLAWANEASAKTAPKSALGKALHYLSLIHICSTRECPRLQDSEAQAMYTGQLQLKSFSMTLPPEELPAVWPYPLPRRPGSAHRLPPWLLRYARRAGCAP